MDGEKGREREGEKERERERVSVMFIVSSRPCFH